MQQSLPSSLKIDENGWITGVRQVLSPNFNERPQGCPIDLLVIHNISLPPGQFGGGFIEKFFSNSLVPSEHSYFEEIADLQVSSHLLIDRQGEVTQFVSFAKRAWHAGVSEFDGRVNCNDFSIGIELEGTDEEPYTESQYQCLVAVSHMLLTHYPEMSAERITGHSDIAPGRKTDPGPAFDWKKYNNMLGV